ncbi:hypothetical protein NPIL_125681 [Nephila pilipes]|uniref:Uncharacterized protein n=1 Tax=Nephila pilipes TaxID=299642 RepID=A0A8X6PT84_NEPPI|nr:hypothetical protein NPIL_125681 [Nephila pilipes]
MSRKKVFKTAEEVVEYLFSEELESEMIVLPPEVDEFTDEEGFDNSETLDPSARQLSDIVALQIVPEEPGNQACSGRNHADRVGRAEDVQMETPQLLVVSPREFDIFIETICRLPSPGPLGR